MFMHPGAFFGGRGRRGVGGRGGRGGLGLLFLAAQVQRMGIENIPSFTLGLLAVNVGGYLGFVPGLANVWRMCLSVQYVVGYGEWYRLLGSAFCHADDFHLSWNMSSLMWKGYHLERAMGLARFASMVLIFLFLTPAIHLALAYFLFASGLMGGEALTTCSVGFSGILFALKVLATLDSSAIHDVMYGLFKVEGRFVVWAELLIIHLIHPGTSFLGHLSGILAGLLYARGYLRPLVHVTETVVAGLVEASGAGYTAFQQANGAAPRYREYDADYGDDRDVPPPYRGAGTARDDAARREAADAALRRRGL
eukprot:Rhum_TRINITY_DN12389_c0_g1::Rhum_TRINITY_DN12389_c0_g1_i1::g.51476::m.51476/K09651/RHBDD1; rhomboid domain-containing protein 1